MTYLKVRIKPTPIARGIEFIYYLGIDKRKSLHEETKEVQRNYEKVDSFAQKINRKLLVRLQFITGTTLANHNSKHCHVTSLDNE